MKCKDCGCCYYGWFPDKPNEYVCIGVKEPFIIKNVNGECTEYPEKNEVNKMNRYICKAKRLDTDEWVYGYFTMHCGVFVANTPVIENEDDDYMVEPDTVCRCTEMRDNKGNMIFEHDIVEHNFFHGESIDEVIYRDGGFYLGVYPISIFISKRIKGNKFDNRNLMEK